MTTTAAVAAGLLSGSAEDDELPIAEVAVRTGLSKDMLRYCEKIRLIETVDRSSPTLHPPWPTKWSPTASATSTPVPASPHRSASSSPSAFSLRWAGATATRGAYQRVAERGLSSVEIVEAITHAAVHCGFPKSLNAMFVAKRIFAQRNLLPVQTPAE